MANLLSIALFDVWTVLEYASVFVRPCLKHLSGTQVMTSEIYVIGVGMQMCVRQRALSLPAG